MLKILILILAVITSCSISLSQFIYPIEHFDLQVQSCDSQTIILTFGYAINATRCIDDTLGNGFVEKEIPIPPPPGGFDARFIDPRGWNDECLGKGIKLNIIPYPTVFRIDTFAIGISNPDTCISARLSWNPSLLNGFFSFLELRDPIGGPLTTINMLHNSTTTINTMFYPYYIYGAFGNFSSSPNFETLFPNEFSLYQNYPNPFNPTTTITYDLPKESNVRLILYDVLGREIRVLVNGRQNAGTKSVTFDGSGLPSGIYFYRLQTGQTTLVKKMMLIR